LGADATKTKSGTRAARILAIRRNGFMVHLKKKEWPDREQ
jgi:hypothetical protein